MTGAALCRAAAALVALALLAAPALAAQSADPAAQSLRTSRVYVSPSVMGEATLEARAELQAVADELTQRGQPVRLAIVSGPVGAPSMRSYVRRMARELDDPDETLVVTAPARPVIAVGPRAPAEITRDLRGGRIGTVRNPVERVTTAARLAVGPAPQPGGADSWRGVGALIGLALLGGAWAGAWGMRRARRGQRVAFIDSRARARVQLDALAARADALAARADLPGEARPELDTATSCARAVQAQLEQARTSEQVEVALPALRDGLAAVARAAAAAGEQTPQDPFEGLCRADPAHGPATSLGATADMTGPVPLCAACADRASRGTPPTRRMVPVAGRPVPFDQAGLGGPASGAAPGGA